MIVRQFRTQGIKAFQAFLAQCRTAPTTPVPRHLLEDETLTELIEPTIEVEQKQLVTRGDAAKYLNQLLAPLPEHEVSKNAGLWTWLTLFFDDAVCPERGGIRSVKNDYYYVFEPNNSRHFYRHLLFISWRVLQLAPDHNRLFLNNPVSRLDGVTTEVMKRLYLTRIPCIFEVLDRLYWDQGRGGARPGMVDSQRVRPGNLVHRLPIRIRQLEKTYDLYSLDADQLIELLGSEFRDRQGQTQLFN